MARITFVEQLPNWLKKEMRDYFIDEIGDESYVDENIMTEQVKNVVHSVDGFNKYYIDTEREEIPTLSDLINEYNYWVDHEQDYEDVTFDEWLNNCIDVWEFCDDALEIAFGDAPSVFYDDGECVYYLESDRYEDYDEFEDACVDWFSSMYNTSDETILDAVRWYIGNISVSYNSR